jgi:uncharacterized membrane protein HdeD (DUF308 family)
MATISERVSSELPVRTLGQAWGWLLAFGMVQIIAGAFAIAVPVIASLAAVIVFGAALLMSAVFHLIHAFKVKKWPGSALYILGGLLYLAGALLVMLFPLGGAMTLTILIATVLIGEGVLRIFLANSVKPRTGWVWLLIGGIASVTIGVMLLTGWPGTALWALGLLLGVNLIFNGATNCALAMTTRKTAHAPNAIPASP